MKGRMGISLILPVFPGCIIPTFVRTIKEDGVDCNPKMSFGKYIKKDGRVLIPFSSQTHHGLTDGYHVGCFSSGWRNTWEMRAGNRIVGTECRWQEQTLWLRKNALNRNMTPDQGVSGEKRGGYSSSNISLPRPQVGQTQSSGTSSQAVPEQRRCPDRRQRDRIHSRRGKHISSYKLSSFP